MQTKFYAPLFAIVFCCTGCSIHRPFVVADQARLIKIQDKTFGNQGELVQTKIAAAKASTAFVIAPLNDSDPYLVYPTTEDLMTVVAAHISDVSNGSICFLVYARSVPVPPQEFSCSLLAAEERDLQNRERAEAEARDRLDKIESQLQTISERVSQTSNDVNTEKGILENYQVALKQHSENIRTSRSDIDTLGKLLGPTASLVKLQSAELKADEKMINLLTERYTQTADAVGKNNEQIDSMIWDLNLSFAQVKATLIDIQQRLAKIQ